MNPPSPARRQRGYVAMMLALSIVVAAMVLGASVVEVAITDARRIAHEQRRQEALAAAESALQRATLRLQQEVSRVRGIEAGDWMEPGRERWQSCDEAMPRSPCSNGNAANLESFDARWSAYGPIPNLFGPQESVAQHAAAFYVARAERPGEARPGWSTLHVIAEGRSTDATATARVRRSYQLRPLLRRIPAAPVELTDVASIAGGFSIDADDGVPTPSILPRLDALSLLFGPDAPALRAPARALEDCASLGPASHGLLWITGDCVVSVDSAIGSAEAPVVLVAESGAVHLLAPVEFFGIVVLAANARGTTELLQSNGPSTLHGALIADRAFGAVAENLTVRYDPAVLRRLLQLGARLSEVPGSWTDHR